MRPVIAWANQVAGQMLVIVISSECEYSHRRRPAIFAQRGESGLACSPIIWSSSDSRPSLPSCLDSVEPFCTSQTVNSTKSVNCRYSDCQFSMTSTQNEDEVR